LITLQGVDPSSRTTQRPYHLVERCRRAFFVAALEPQPDAIDSVGANLIAIEVFSLRTAAGVLYDVLVDLRPGMRIDQYTLLEPLGKGGQGSVWRVFDPVNKTARALKLLDLSALPETAADRARREARAVRELRDHPAIVHCHVLFELPNDIIGLEFDLVRGPPLSEAMHDTRMTLVHRGAVLEQVASALAHVHARGLVHRDLKPSNILITESFWADPRAKGSVKLVDFGIVAPAWSGSGLTAEGRPVGTAPYLAPEVLDPARFAPLSESFAQDVFAFGVLGFELFMHEHPTRLALMSSRRAFVEAYRAADERRLAWPPSGLPAPIAPIVTRCLALDPAARPASGADVAAWFGLDVPRPSGRTPRSARRQEAPTAPHVLPSSVGASTSVKKSLGQTTEMDSVAGPRSARRKRGIGGILLAMAAIGVAGIAAYWMGRQFSADMTPAPVNLVRPVVASTVAPNITTATLLPLSDELRPCCGKSGKCESGMMCGPGDCAAPIPNRFWRLRLTSLAEKPPGAADFDYIRPGSLAAANTTLCLRPPGAVNRSCWPVSAINNGTVQDPIRISTSDIEAGQLEMWVERGGDGSVHARNSKIQGSYTMNTLCIGIRLYVGPKSDARFRVAGFLDPDG